MHHRTSSTGWSRRSARSEALASLMFLGVLISSSPRVGESAGPGAEDAAPASEDSAPAAEERAPPAADAAAPAPESAPSAADVAPTPEEPAPPAADVTPPPEEPAPSAGAPSPSSEGQPGKYAGSCMQDGCHATLKEQANLHGPVAAESCGVCHSAVEGKEHAFELSREEEELCTFCHDMPDPAKVVHKPFEQKACLGCHDPHGGATRAFLIKEEEPGGVCLGCHSRSDAKGLHKPVSEGRCTQCHTPHQSESEKLLVDSGSTTCLACHSKLAESFQAAKSVHKPAAEGQCRPCHRGHESSFGALLASSYPRKPYAGFDEKTYALCLQCHPVEAFTEEQTTRTGFRDGTRNLHYLHANKPRKGRTCGMCHAPHESAEQHLLKKEVPFGTWKLAIGFEPTADGGTCATGCHRKATYARGPASPGPAGSGAEEAGKPAAKAGSAAPKKAKKTRKASPPGADVGSPGK